MPSLPRTSSLLQHLWLLPLVLLLAGCSSPGTSSSISGDDLPRLMVERLGWMDDVARFKQARSLPVTDAKREAELLTAMELQGTQKGLPAAAVRSFFSGQMEAARECQKEWLEQHPVPSAAPLPDLAGTIRPALDQISRQMLTALESARKTSNHTDLSGKARHKLNRAGHSPAVIAPAVKGLEEGLR